MISRFFIDRPVFAAVISIVIIMAGLMAMRSLPIAQYPQILPPQVSVSASYAGASAQVIAETVAAPLEQSINGVEGMIYQQSNSGGNAACRCTSKWVVIRIRPPSTSTTGCKRHWLNCPKKCAAKV